MRKKSEPTEANIFRMELGCRLLIELNDNDELPIKNIHRLGKTMQEYFKRLGMVDELKEQGYKWRPDHEYWKLKMSDISTRLRVEYNMYFGYTYKPGEKCTEGEWKFMTPEEWEKTLKIKHVDIGTRVEHQNEKIDQSVVDFSVNIPHIEKVPLLN